MVTLQFQELPAAENTETTVAPFIEEAVTQPSRATEYSQTTLGSITTAEERTGEPGTGTTPMQPELPTTPAPHLQPQESVTTDSPYEGFPTVDEVQLTTKPPQLSEVTTAETVTKAETNKPTTTMPHNVDTKDTTIVTESPDEILDTTTVIATSISTSEAIVYFNSGNQKESSLYH